MSIMKSNSLNIAAVALSCLGMLISPVSAAGAPIAAPRDVMLQDGGVLVGQIVDAQGSPVAMAPILLLSGDKEVARARSDQTGKFKVGGLKGGVYQVASAGRQGVYRLWAPRTAPPAAQRGLMVVSGENFVRAQSGASGPFGGVGNWVSNHPLMTAGAVAAAIAIPLALDDDDWHPPMTP